MTNENDDRVRVDPPRVLSHETFQFNFKVSIGARIMARAGAPSWSRRKKRLDDRLVRFWREQEEHAAALWVAAAEGRIGDDGRENPAGAARRRRSRQDRSPRAPRGAVP